MSGINNLFYYSFVAYTAYTHLPSRPVYLVLKYMLEYGIERSVRKGKNAFDSKRCLSNDDWVLIDSESDLQFDSDTVLLYDVNSIGNPIGNNKNEI
jgi:hypothetical protein